MPPIVEYPPAEEISVVEVLRDIRTLLEALNDKLGQTSDSRSSVEIAQAPKVGDMPRVTVKVYAGSDIAEPVCAAVEAYGALYREVQAQSLNGWAETVEAVKEGR